MNNRRRREKLIIDEITLMQLKKITNARTETQARAQRARILIQYHEGKTVTQIAKEFEIERPKIERCIDKAQAYGILESLEDLPRSGRKVKITDDAKAWVLSIACIPPKELGYAPETWTYRELINHIRANCEKAGYNCLKQLGKGRLHSILSKSNIKPHKVSYYLEKRDPEFDEKLANILCVYKEIELINSNPTDDRKSVTVSYDEKPGIQAIKNIGAQLSPVPGAYPNIGRDPEYKRLGTVSLLAGIDLHNGKVYPLVREQHRSIEFIEFLSILDREFPPDWNIRIILDNHSSHTSKESKTYLLTKPNRFSFVFTPKHGSWLNLIEVFFSKIARSLLRFIRVETKEELIDRIYKGIDEINQTPVVFRWKYKMDAV